MVRIIEERPSYEPGARVTVAAAPSTGYEPPTDQEIVALLQIVRAAHPEVPAVDVGEFRRAMRASGCQFRRNEPDERRYFTSHLDAGNELLAGLGLSSVSAGAFFLACRAHCDIPITFADPSRGIVMTLGLDPYVGLKCRNAWRGLVTGTVRLPVSYPPSMRPREEASPASVRLGR